MRSPPHFLPLLWLYARTYWVVTALLTGFVVSQCWRYGSGPLSALIYFKLITTAVLALVTYRKRQPTMTFYQNLGLIPLLLMGYAVSIDLLLCAVLVTLVL